MPFLFLTLPLNIKMPFAVVTDRNAEERRSSRKSIASPAAVRQSLLSISEKTGNYLQTSFKPAGVSEWEIQFEWSISQIIFRMHLGALFQQV